MDFRPPVPVEAARWLQRKMEEMGNGRAANDSTAISGGTHQQSRYQTTVQGHQRPV